MSRAVEEAKDEVRERLSDDWLDHVLARLPASARSDVLFGPPVDRGDVTVVPVARVRYGFGFGRGGGSGPRGLGTGEGGGGGGGVIADPVGFIEIRGGKTRFKAVRPGFGLREALVALSLVAVVLTAVTAFRNEGKV